MSIPMKIVTGLLSTGVEPRRKSNFGHLNPNLNPKNMGFNPLFYYKTGMMTLFEGVDSIGFQTIFSAIEC